MSFASAFSSNAVSICQACGLTSIDRLEKSRRFLIHLSSTSELTPRAMSALRDLLHDKMTEQEYKTPIDTFEIDIETEQVQFVPIMKEGRKALEKINAEKGLGFDDFDLDYYTNLFKVRYHYLLFIICAETIPLTSYHTQFVCMIILLEYKPNKGKTTTQSI